ncbi:MAG: hypothetical protein ACREEN_01645 [Stellaceae bacterium]
MSRGLLKISLDLIAQEMFDGKVRIETAFVTNADVADGTITAVIEGNGIPPVPINGRLAMVRCIETHVVGGGRCFEFKRVSDGKPAQSDFSTKG